MGVESEVKANRGSTEPQGGGWHKTPDALVDELILKGKLSPGGLQLGLLLIIIRNTWGAMPNERTGQRPAWAALSITALAKMCSSGRGYSDGYTPRAVATALNDLMARGIISGKNAKGQLLRGSLTGEERETANKSTAAGMYQATPATWKAAKKYVAPEVEKISKLEAEPDEVAPEVEKVAAGDPVILLPGAKSRPMPMRIALKGRDPVDVRWRAVNSGTSALTCLVEPDAAGLLTFTVSEKGEAKANDYVSRLRKFAATAGIDEPGEGTPSRVAAYRNYMGELMMRHWQKPADADFLMKVIAAAGDAPVEVFSAVVADRIGDKNPKKLKSGILVELAKDAARRYGHTRAERDREERDAQAKANAERAEVVYWQQADNSPWALVKKALKTQISDASFANWFARTRGVAMDNGNLIVEVPDAGSADFLASEYGELAKTNARGVRRDIDGVRFVVRGAANVRGAAA